MKKIFLFAAAAMVSLSSCVQTEDVYTGGLNEMGFKSAVTRAIVQTNDDMTYPISVSSVWDNPASAEAYVPYFTNTKFALTDGVWKATPAKYWPNAGKMQFLALCPADVTAATLTYDGNNGTFAAAKIYVENNLVDQNDILYSDLLAVDAPQQSAQPLLFHHALAQLNVTLNKVETNAVVTVNSVKVVNASLNGTLTVLPTTTASEGQANSLVTKAEWAEKVEMDRYFLADATATSVEDYYNATLTTEAQSPAALLVIPSAQTQIVIEYTVDGKNQTYTHTLTGDWEMGYKYTYNYTISVNEITFDCHVDNWVPADGGTITI